MTTKEFLCKYSGMGPLDKVIEVDEIPSHLVHACKNAGVVRLKASVVKFESQDIRYVACPKCRKIIYSVNNN